MSDFSDTLRYYITEKGTKIYDLTKQLGIDRSTLYQISAVRSTDHPDRRLYEVKSLGEGETSGAGEDFEAGKTGLLSEKGRGTVPE